MIVQQLMAIPLETTDDLTMFPSLERQAIDQVAVPKQGTTGMAASNSAKGTGNSQVRSSGSAVPSRIGDNRLRDSGSMQ